MAVEKEVPIAGKVVMRLDEASFWYNENYPMLKETSFNLREGQKLTLMGPNGAGKSTLFSIIMGENQLTEGRIIIDKELKVAIAKQHIPHTKWDITVRDFLEEAFAEKKYEIDKLAEEVFKIVELKVSLDLTLRKLSGGQKGRLLIAQALIYYCSTSRQTISTKKE
jgi:ABC-type Mn2+/Zn2+ transport system ATPase subunit